MNAFFSYLIAITIAPALGLALGGIAGVALLCLSRNVFFSFASGFIESWLSLEIGMAAFDFFDVDFNLISWLCVFLPVMLFEGQRYSKSEGHAKRHQEIIASGALIAALVFLLLAI